MINFPAKITQRFKQLLNSSEAVNVKLLTVGGLREINGLVSDVFARNNNEYIKINDKTVSAEEVAYINNEYVYFAEQDKHRAFTELDFDGSSPIIDSNGKTVTDVLLSGPDALVPDEDVLKATDNWTKVAVGGYLERRKMYAVAADLYGSEDVRNTHLGVDIWAESGTHVNAPIDGVFYGICDNKGKGNYGPTIILKHNIKGCSFFTLYGHLSRASLQERVPGGIIRAGEQLGAIGDSTENGEWPPHLHFQVVLNMLGMYNDFPGVCRENEAEFFANICPNPMTLVRWQ